MSPQTPTYWWESLSSEERSAEQSPVAGTQMSLFIIKLFQIYSDICWYLKRILNSFSNPNFAYSYFHNSFRKHQQYLSAGWGFLTCSVEPVFTLFNFPSTFLRLFSIFHHFFHLFSIFPQFFDLFLILFSLVT